MEHLLLVNPEKASEKDVQNYNLREAVRAVVLDKSNLVGLVYSKRFNHFKIPGGGIEKGENHVAALKRECIEEIGINIGIVGEIGSIKEYRKFNKLIQISYGYLAKVKGDKNKPTYMQDEIEDGFQPMWMPFSKALKSISLNRASSFEGKNYIVPRDSTFLREAKNLI